MPVFVATATVLAPFKLHFRNVQDVERLKFSKSLKDFLVNEPFKGKPVEQASLKDIPFCDKDTTVKESQLLKDL